MRGRLTSAGFHCGQIGKPAYYHKVLAGLVPVLLRPRRQGLSLFEPGRAAVRPQLVKYFGVPRPRANRWRVPHGGRARRHRGLRARRALWRATTTTTTTTSSPRPPPIRGPPPRNVKASGETFQGRRRDRGALRARVAVVSRPRRRHQLRSMRIRAASSMTTVMRSPRAAGVHPDAGARLPCLALRRRRRGCAAAAAASRPGVLPRRDRRRGRGAFGPPYVEAARNGGPEGAGTSSRARRSRASSTSGTTTTTTTSPT